MAAARTIDIDGLSVPTFIYGTAWKEEATRICVRNALEAGFRAIDTANQRKHYFEAEVGVALREAYGGAGLRREDLFLQTKFTYQDGQDHRLPYDPGADLHSQVMQSFAVSLEHLHTDYLDSYILHGPSRRTGLGAEDWEVWRAMEELYRSGRAKLLGVSNVQRDQLEALCEKCAVKPRFVQNRCYASRGWDREVRAFCTAHGIAYQGFSLLTANTGVASSKPFHEVAARHGCSPAQLIFCFALALKMIPLTGTTDPIHMRQDLDAYRFELSAEEISFLEQIGG